MAFKVGTGAALIHREVCNRRARGRRPAQIDELADVISRPRIAADDHQLGPLAGVGALRRVLALAVDLTHVDIEVGRLRREFARFVQDTDVVGALNLVFPPLTFLIDVVLAELEARIGAPDVDVKGLKCIKRFTGTHLQGLSANVPDGNRGLTF